MGYVSQTQWLFWGGIGSMSAAALLAVICLIVFIITGQKLKKRLEQEYGKPQL